MVTQKSDKSKLAFFSESVTYLMQIEINAVSYLYKADRISGKRAHEKLHQASKDLSNNLFSRVSQMIAREHSKVDFLHKVKQSMAQDLDSKQFLPQPEFFEDDLKEEVSFEDMKVKKISDANDDLAER